MQTRANDWDARVAKTTGWCHFLQSAEWAEALKQTAWRPNLTEVKVGQGSYRLNLHSRSVPLIGRIYQATKLARLQPAQARAFTQGLRRQAESGVAIKIDLDQPFDEKLHQSLLKQGWLRTPSMQYQETVLIDLTRSREELLKSFKKRARWELNAGLRRGVKVEKAALTDEHMAIAYELLRSTYERAHFQTRSRAFTENYWRAFAASGQGSLYFAKLDNQLLAAAFIIHIGDRAYYKDGASVRLKPDVFASRVMQWQIMQDLKEQGIKTYDLCGVSTNNTSDLKGVTLFKTGFGEPVRLQWGYELPLSSWRYNLWKQLIEPVVLKYSATIRRELWY
ncbi:peptidoglycan bridge formation glycyltransferase FemA/FemB family protein [Candidatus Saccharibacteria bacterium]|nr:peptidoglycan bridge formation glycyltransferase FemA/FemB family protein [Candidatus Saccharibacteria bacterium]